MAMNQLACNFVKSGGLGRIRLVLGVNYPPPVRIGPMPEEAAPATPDCSYKKKVGPPKSVEVPVLTLPDAEKTRPVVESVA